MRIASMTQKEARACGRTRAEVVFREAAGRWKVAAEDLIKDWFAGAAARYPYPTMRAIQAAADARWKELVRRRRRKLRAVRASAILLGLSLLGGAALELSHLLGWW
jgi:hypothetical protein